MAFLWLPVRNLGIFHHHVYFNVYVKQKCRSAFLQ